MRLSAGFHIPVPNALMLSSCRRALLEHPPPHAVADDVQAAVVYLRDTQEPVPTPV